MPPKGSKIAVVKPEFTFEKSEEFEAFITKLEEFHAKRGTTFDSEPKIGARYLNLHALYERVIGEGGYDINSDTRAKPLMWRKFAEEFLGKSPHLAAQAFQVKSAYYKNLAAYEIADHWKKDPPPKEILEDLTARGGGIMGRTLENYQKPSQEEDRLGNGESDSEDGDDKTPKREKGDTEEPGSVPGRSTRGLRQAPPQRVLFQPDLNPARQSRTASNQIASPSPGLMPANALNGPVQMSNITNATLANYEPRQQYPLTLKPVVTPSNNPDYYRLKRKQAQEASASQVAKRFKGIMLPGTGFIGPNIYVRAQLALTSGIAEEEQYALHHLVKISHERGDKYRFDQFPGLAEALINKVLQISSLFYDIDWAVTYTDEPVAEDDCALDGLYGTSDVVEKLKARIPLDTDDNMQDAGFAHALGRIIEASLIIRNMVMLDENAQYVARMPLLRDYFCIVLGLQHPCIIELQHYALDTAEQLGVYYQIDSRDPFYQTLLSQLDSGDRGKIVTSLRTLSRLGMRLQENKRLEDVPVTVLKNLIEWIMIDDEEMRSACLDFLYQFTSIADNVEFLLKELDAPAIVRTLSRLLLQNAKEHVQKDKIPRKANEPVPPIKVPRLARELLEQLFRHEEPERSSHWLRMCFQDDPTAEMTQIDLWKSYQGTFLPYAATHPHMIAGDFIKNVSTTFQGASAQVAGSHKYVIRGIKPRAIPVDYRGRELSRCHWRTGKSATEPELSTVFAEHNGECSEWFPNPTSIQLHILLTHLHIPRKRAQTASPEEDGTSATKSLPPLEYKFLDFAAAPPTQTLECHWSSCTHKISATDVPNVALRGALMARHITTHLPDASPTATWKTKHHITAEDASKIATTKTTAPAATRTFLNTLTDERNDAAGVPLGAVLILRNIARGISRLRAGPAAEAILTKLGAHAEELVPEPEDVKEQQADRDAQQIDGLGEGEDDAPAAPEQRAVNKVVMKLIFDPIRQKIFFAMAHNLTLRDYLAALLKFVRLGDAR